MKHMEERGKKVNLKNLLRFLVVTILVAIFAVTSYLVLEKPKIERTMAVLDNELLRAMNYEQIVDGDENVEGTDNVKFSAFFLRDLDGDGYAEKIKGTCKEIGKEDTLYMEVIVQSEGYLKDGKIQIDGKNFYLQTALPKDGEIKENYIGNDIKAIEFEKINSGTQKLLIGMVRSGDYSYDSLKISAIGNNINNYSRNDNKVTLTGIYVNESNVETEIRKEIDLNMDWYGITKTTISKLKQKTNDLLDRIEEENETLNLSFSINTSETANKLLLSKNYVEGIIPELNGFKPISVTTETSGVDFTYEEETGEFTITKKAQIDANGQLVKKAYTDSSSSARMNKYTINVTYPLEAYRAIDDHTVTITIPVSTYFEGYNNPNTEFKNPYKSNVARETIVANFEKPTGEGRFEITVGKYVTSPTKRYVVSKRKPLETFNGKSQEDNNDLYTIKWYGYTGIYGASSGMTMKETTNGGEQVADQFVKTDTTKETMENVTTNVGIGFERADDLIGAEGWIKIYDEETNNLLVSFTSNGVNGTQNWGRYTETEPYYYENPVKHIRIETSAINPDSSISVYNIKKIDDEYLTANYTREEFNNLSYIQSQVVGYFGDKYVNTDVNQANYEAPFSIAKIEMDNNVLSTQQTEENKIIKITADAKDNYNQENWYNGIFLIKMPDEILEVKINNISTNNTNIEILSYETIENENGRFIKIYTTNKVDSEQSYVISVDCNLTSDPRISTMTRKIELYAINEAVDDYYYKSADIYDVNDNFNTEEIVNKTETSINMVSPNSLLTNQTMEVNKDGNVSSEIVVSPQILELRPLYEGEESKKQEVKIGVQIKNNYSNTISEVTMIGKIPFEGNNYVLSQGDLNSEFSTTMKSGGIEIPEELEEYVTIYYSENESPTKNLQDEENGWTSSNNITDWTKIKSYRIDLGNKVINQGKEYVFYYTVEIPNGIDLNKKAYSHHGVYFSIDTEEGKYRTQTEPNKIGVCISERYNLIITKYQKDRDKVVQGSTYKVSRLNENGDIEETSTATTNSTGKLEMTNLYAEKEYMVEEIKTPEEYELNNEIIKFIGHVNENGILTVEKKQGGTKGDITVTKQTGEDYKVNLSVEDEVRTNIKIIKKDKATNEPIRNVRYKITGEGLPESGKNITTNLNGEAILKGLKIGKEYVLEETKVEGYYLDEEQIIFTILNNEGTYSINIANTESLKTATITENDSIPTINIEVVDEKIQTYNLKITKIKKLTQVEEGQGGSQQEEVEYLAGAKFKLYKDGKELGTYVTDENGNLLIENLYQYRNDKNLSQTYVLKEVIAPEGYSKVKDIVFYAEQISETQTQTVVDETTGEEREEDVTVTRIELKQEIEDGEKEKNWAIEGNTINIIVENIPSFKLIKKDGETGEGLAGVKFAIYEADGSNLPAQNGKGEFVGTKETINGKDYYVVTTNSNGEITVDLQEGLYKAVEIETDEKYDLGENTYYFGIGASRAGKTSIKYDWAKGIGGTDEDSINAVLGTTDGGYIVGGYFKSSSITVGNDTLINHGDSDGMIIKYSQNGEVEWTTSFGDIYSEGVNSIIETPDGGFIVGGYFGSASIILDNYTCINKSNSKHTDALIIKYNQDGEVEWADSFGSKYSEKITTLSETTDGGFIAGEFFAGTIAVGDYTLANHGAHNGTDGMIIKYSNTREVEWATSIGGTGADQINSVLGTKDGGFMVVGYYRGDSLTVGEYTFTNPSSSYMDGIIIKYNQNKEIEWIDTVSGNGHDSISSITETADGGYVAVGSAERRNGNVIAIGDVTIQQTIAAEAGLIIKYSQVGEIEWTNCIGGTNRNKINAVVGTTDGGYIVAGYGDYFFDVDGYRIGAFGGNNDGFIIKYNSLGKADWAYNIGGKSNDQINSMSKATGGEYIIGGNFKSVNITDKDIDLICKGNSDGFILKVKEKEIPEMVIKRADNLGDNHNNSIYTVIETNDGGYIAGGAFAGDNITVGNYTLTNNGTYGTDGMVIKCNSEGEVEWANCIGGRDRDRINSIIGTQDGGCIAVGSFNGGEIIVGGNTFKTQIGRGHSHGMIVKFNSRGEPKWVKLIAGVTNDYLTSIASTTDGGFVVGGYSDSDTIKVGDYTLRNHGEAGTDGIIIKYNSVGEVEWAEYVGGTGREEIASVSGTQDGGYVVGGDFRSSSIKVGNYTLINHETNYTDGMVIKYSQNGEVEWAECIGENLYDSIYSVSGTQDGGCIVGGKCAGSITVGEYTITNQTSHGIIIKYGSNGEVEWANSTRGGGTSLINLVLETRDGGYIVGGEYNKPTIADYCPLNNNGLQDGMMIKYNSAGEVEWAENIGGTDNDYINSIVETQNGEYLIGGGFNDHNDQVDGMGIKVVAQMGAPEVQELEIKNKRKEYKITTDIKEIDGIKGGTISGEDAIPYEFVKYGDANEKQIKMIPDQDFEIIDIKVNGEDWSYEPESDGSYTMPIFESINEDKHIVVTFSMKNNKITINKMDSVSGATIEGVEFKLDQIEERTEPVNSDIIGVLSGNSINYSLADYDKEVDGFIDLSRDLKNIEGVNYYFVPKTNVDGTTSYVPTNSKTWQAEHIEGATVGIQSSTANSYVELDLSDMTGYYKVVVNGYVSSENGYDIGYATITTEANSITNVGSIPSYDNTSAPNSRFVYISGTGNTTPVDKESTIALEGGQKYYLHLGYRKDSGRDDGEDQFVINSVKLYETKDVQYSFVEEGGKYVSTNQEIDNTTCNSYIPIDLEEYTGKCNIIVNAEISTRSGDYGYVTLNTIESPSPEYNSNTTTNRRFVYITGSKSAQDYTIEVDGGYKYYLHLGYYKDADSNTTGNDVFTVNRILVNLSDSELYHTTVSTNSSGQAITQIPYGKYRITETKTTDDYVLKAIPIVKDDEGNVINTNGIIEFRSTEGNLHEYTVENEKYGHITVHHYIKGTATSIADDEYLTGEQGESYTTKPKFDIAEYELEKDDNDEYIMPGNYQGEFTYDDQEVNYYYVQRGALLTVNHLIEGTDQPVILSTGEEAEPQTSNGQEGTPYTTNALTKDEIAEKFEIAEDEMPDNAEGTYEYDEVIVNYYYRVKRFNINTEVEEYEKTNILGETELIRGGSISGENMAPYEKVEYDEDSVEDIFIEPDPGYVIKNIKVNDEPIDFEPEPDGTVMLSKFMSVRRNINVAVSFDKDVSQVIVHHYLEGTSDKVPSIYGGVVEDETKIGSIGDPYVTKPTDEISERYEVVNTPDNASGEFKDTTTEVTYYYREVPAKVITNHLINGTTEPVPLNNGTLAQSSTEDGYVTKPYTTEPLTDIDDEYVLVGDSGNTTGNMTKEDTIVNYYYAPKAYAKVNYIAEDWDGNYETLETIDYEGYDGEVYTSHSKDYTGYTLTDVPEYETYELTSDAITVFNYYYKKNPVKVSLIEKHVDLYTSEIKYTKEYEEAWTGDSYEINRQVFDGYKIATNKKYYDKFAEEHPEILSTNSVETVDELLDALGLNGEDPYIPKNYKGVLKNEPVEVVYYYVKEAKVIVEYHDINGDDPTNPIHPDDVVPGLEKDPYKVEPIDIDGYDLVTDSDYTPTNTEGEMDRDDIIVKYYYVYKTDVVVNHIDISNESKIDSDKKEGHEKDLYKMDQMDLSKHPDYRIVTNKEYYDYAVEKDPTLLDKNGVTTVDELLAKLELGALDSYIPANYKGEMTKDEIVVNYYYKKQAKVTVKHIDEATGTVLKTEEATYDVGDTYTTGPETIENYTLNEDKLPGNATGEVKEGGVEVKYYYNKKTTPVTPDPGGNTPIPEPTPQPNPTPNPGPGPAPAPQPQPSSPAPQSPVVTTAKKIYNKVLPKTGDTTIHTATSIIIMVILLNMLVTDKVNQGSRNETKVEKDKKRKVKGKRFK